MSKKAKKINSQSFNYPELKNSFNTLLANIRFASIDKPIKTVVVTSVGANEGKTTISSNLALAMANSGQQCLVIDCDMRKRSLSSIIGVHPKYGLYSVLSGKCRVEEAVTATQIPNMYFLDTEPGIPNPADILSSERFECLIKFLYTKFDYIVFDTPPLISFVDGAMLGSLADATLLVVREGKTKKADIKNAVNQLQQAKAHILGTVLSFRSDNTDSYYYYAYYNKEGKRVHKHSKQENYVIDVNKSEINSNLSSWLNESEQKPQQTESQGLAFQEKIAQNSQQPVSMQSVTQSSASQQNVNQQSAVQPLVEQPAFTETSINKSPTVTQPIKFNENSVNNTSGLDISSASDSYIETQIKIDNQVINKTSDAKAKHSSGSPKKKTKPTKNDVYSSMREEILNSTNGVAEKNN